MDMQWSDLIIGLAMTKQVGMCLKMISSSRKPRKFALCFKNAFRVRDPHAVLNVTLYEKNQCFKLENRILKRYRDIKMMYFVGLPRYLLPVTCKTLRVYFWLQPPWKEARGRKHRTPSSVSTSGNMGQSSEYHHWKARDRNMGFGFGMVFLSSVQAEIYVFPVWAAAILGSDCRFHGTVFVMKYTSSLIQQTGRQPLKFCVYHVYNVRWSFTLSIA